MRKEVAEVVVEELRSCSGKLDRSLALLVGAVDDDFFVRYRTLVGQAMGLLYIDVLREIFREYPELEPESIRSGGAQDD